MYINLAAAEINFRLQSLGFVYPFVSAGGTALTADQSNFLKLLNALAAVSLYMTSQQPGPVGPTERPFGEGNSVLSAYNRVMRHLEATGGYGLGLEAYVGTLADKQFAQVRGPMADLYQNKRDIRDFMSLFEYTGLTEIIQNNEVMLRKLQQTGVWDFVTITNGLFS